MPVPEFNVRPFAHGDELCLHRVFHSAIHTHAAPHHSCDQLLAWSPEIIDASSVTRWVERMQAIRPFVVEVVGGDETGIAAYADLQPDGYIDHFYVAGPYGGRGVGKRLMTHLLEDARDHGIAVLTSDVSFTAEGFFARFGFVPVARQTVVVRGVEFSNTKMRRDLASRSGEDDQAMPAS